MAIALYPIMIFIGLGVNHWLGCLTGRFYFYFDY
jgi:hypothetical protein